jgi:(E)-4-hydroxy-3-methylbut-2-enyl-diphosphate synthase
MVTHRKDTRPVRVGPLTIGGSDRVYIQSMTTTKTADVDATVAQIHRLEEAGCELVRVTVNTPQAAEAVKEIKRQISIPLVADIHFDYRLALRAIENGVDKVRLNPGNIGGRERVEAVVRACKERGVPIRIGVNTGSLEKSILERDGYPTARGLVDSALHHIRILEDLDFTDIVVSVKASTVPLAIEAYRLAAESFSKPLHHGKNESGTLFGGTIKSAAGLGALLHMGIGNTIRVSLSADPVEEVRVARELLKAFGIISNAVTVVSCPTCGRIDIDLISVANEIERYVERIQAPIRVSVLGCAVNGPGEARESDIGIAGAKGEGLLFLHGQVARKVPEERLVAELKREIDAMAERYARTGSIR